MTYEKTAEENLKQMIFPQTKKDDFEEFCIALSDEICYPKYVYSAYEHCKSEKELVKVPYAPHCIPYSFNMKVFTEFAKMAEEV